MTEHGDMIRHLREFLSAPVYRSGFLAALDALLAERQQAIDALQEIVRSDMGTLGANADIARAALAKLGEQPK